MQRKASAVWKGGLKDGKGTISGTSAVLSTLRIPLPLVSKTLREPILRS